MVLNIKNYNCYFILSSFLIIFEFILIKKGHWVGDFFEHSAVVNELSKNLFHPNNPIISSEIAHAFFSPYSFVVGFFSKVSGFNSIDSLAYFAFFNLIFFLYSLYVFSKSIFPKKYNLIASLALIFIMFFWGKSPFVWSGFYHIFVLHYVLAYPSTFAVSLMLLTLGLVSKNKIKYYLVVIFCNAIVLISHPPTAVILFISICTMCFCFNDYSLKRGIIKSFILIVPSVLLSFFWPYFNIIDLFVGNKSTVDFHISSSLMYTDIFKRNWPILLAIPSFIYSKKDSNVMFLALTTVLLLLVYVAGYLFDFHGISRVISGAMLFSHLLIAYNTIYSLDELKIFNKFYLLFLISTFLISISLNFSQLGKVVLSILKEKDIEYHSKFSFLRKEVQPNDIILSDTKSSWIIPSYNGKVISSSCSNGCKHPLYWVDNYQQRRTDVNSFFKKESSDSLRFVILQEYEPDYLLINYFNVDISCSTYEYLKSLSETIYEENNLELLKLH